MLQPGIYPAAVTPMNSAGQPDLPSMARLLAYFDAAGCPGVVIAGTNGEGPSLSAPEKRDLFRACKPMLGKLSGILGIATASLEEAVWLGKQAAKDGADAILVMPPSYFRGAPLERIQEWFIEVMNRVELPLIAYNFPKMTGIELTPTFIQNLAQHPNFMGLKDASGSNENLHEMPKAVLPHHLLLAGDATPIQDALNAGWHGTISGAANVIPHWQVQALQEQSSTKHDLVRTVIQKLIAHPQPAMNKALLAELGVIEGPFVRLPLAPADPLALQENLEFLGQSLGMKPGSLGLTLP